MTSFQIIGLEDEFPGIRAVQEQLPDKMAEGGDFRYT
jgi:hypothetical protein